MTGGQLLSEFVSGIVFMRKTEQIIFRPWGGLAGKK